MHEPFISYEWSVVLCSFKSILLLLLLYFLLLLFFFMLVSCSFYIHVFFLITVIHAVAVTSGISVVSIM